MNPLPNSGTVLGLCYETKVRGIEGYSYDTTEIFIPSLKIIIGKHAVKRAEKASTTKIAKEAMSIYQEEISDLKREFNEAEWDVRKKEAQAKSMKEVQVPLYLVYDALTLLAQREELEKQRITIGNSMTRIVQQIFSNQ